MPILDVHQHLWPPQLIAALRRRTKPPFLDGDCLTTVEGTFLADLEAHDLTRRLAALDAAGIDTAVVSFQPTLGFDLLPWSERRALVSAYEEGIVELVAASGGRLRAFAAGSGRRPFVGVCVGASRLLRPEWLEETLDELEQNDGVLFVHPDCGPPALPVPSADWTASVVGYTAQLQAAYFAWLDRGAARWPDLRVLFALLAGGAPFQLERLASRGVDTRRLIGLETFFETSSYGRISLELCLASFGLDRLVHGSDLPVLDPVQTMSAIRALGKAAAHAICDSNPVGLLQPRRELRFDARPSRARPDAGRAARGGSLART
jgi:predicted TIM-barrel fold metal-dependent hydrolase